MPWDASTVMEERLRFVARLLEGEAMTEVCREFGISSKTGYKIFDRYKEHGLAALNDRSRRPVRYANQLPQQVESLIVRLKGEKPHWGARKIRELLVRQLDGDIRVPAKSTVHAVLDRHGLVRRGGGPRHRARDPEQTRRGGVGHGIAGLRRQHRRDQDLEGILLLILGNLLDRRLVEARDRLAEPPHDRVDPPARHVRLGRPGPIRHAPASRA